MSVDYNKISKKFSNSRIWMKWPETSFFMEYLEEARVTWKNILDIWCGNGRLLDSLTESNIMNSKTEYLWIDLSQWLVEEAKKLHPDFSFNTLDMLDIEILERKFDIIFMIASFHHLDTSEKRVEFLKKVSSILNDWWYICMTNWNLYSDINSSKYSDSIIKDSKNSFWNFDFHIKFWEYLRYYHGFNTTELESLFLNNWFKICENRVFENEKNIISIIKK